VTLADLNSFQNENGSDHLSFQFGEEVNDEAEVLNRGRINIHGLPLDYGLPTPPKKSERFCSHHTPSPCDDEEVEFQDLKQALIPLQK
jgi:hypothetical protein